MAVMADDIMRAGIAAAKAADYQNARSLLAQAVKANPTSDEAWFWLGIVLSEPDRREFCFRRVLLLNPNHAQAKEQLERTQMGPASPVPAREQPPAPEPTPTATISDSTPPRDAPPPVIDVTAADYVAPPVASTTHREPAPVTAPAREETPTLIPPVPSAPAKESGAPSGVEKVLVALFGLVLALLVCAGPPVYLIQTGRLDSALQIAGVVPVQPTNTPSATPRPSPTPAPTATNTLVMDPSTYNPQPSYTAAEAKREFRSLFTQGRYAEDIEFLDRVIASGTNDSEAYYIRAASYQRLMANQRTLGEYEAYNERALADLNKAIEMDPTIGDFYYARGDAYSSWASIQEYRADRDPLLEVALENYRTAMMLGDPLDLTGVSVPDTLYALGRCSEVLAEAQRMDEPSEAALNTMLALGNLCSGNSTAALKQIDTAIKLNPNNVRKFYRAIILFNAARLKDALAQLNEILESSPDYNGYRYFLRALVYYDLKQPDRARQDLTTGSSNTWGRGGLMAYVQARLLMDAGDKTRGLEQLRFAEATMSHEYGPLLDRIRKEMTQFNAAPLAPTLSVHIARTPIPAPKVTPTKAVVPIPSNPVKVDLAVGTGLLTLAGYADQPISLFQPSPPISYKSVQSLTFRIVSQTAIAQPPLQLYLLNLTDHTWDTVNLMWGNNIIIQPGKYVGSGGQIYAALRNYSPDTISINNSGFKLTVVNTDGTVATYGLK
jgi:tetratricopeptide (TPR) repeat protein